jgi:membrane protein DedA with SNARE-associated domain
MSLTELLAHYGYAVVLVGTFLEGETILVMAGFAAHQGYLSLPWVMLMAFLGGMSGDQLAFLAGRRYGARLLQRFPRLKPGVTRATALLARRGTPLLLGFRFVYGVRNLVPIAAGLSALPVPRFIALNVIGAATWSVAVSAAGYAFGRGFSLLLERARDFEEHALVALLVAGACFAAVRFVARRGWTKPRPGKS